MVCVQRLVEQQAERELAGFFGRVGEADAAVSGTRGGSKPGRVAALGHVHDP